MYQLLAIIICAILINACTSTNNNINSINIGSIKSFSPMHTMLPKKPKKEISRICHTQSLFSTKNLTINDLLQKAYESHKQYIFKNVGLWYENINILYLWERECLILGKI